MLKVFRDFTIVWLAGLITGGVIGRTAYREWYAKPAWERASGELKTANEARWFAEKQNEGLRVDLRERDDTILWTQRELARLREATLPQDLQGWTVVGLVTPPSKEVQELDQLGLGTSAARTYLTAICRRLADFGARPTDAKPEGHQRTIQVAVQVTKLTYSDQWEVNVTITAYDGRWQQVVVDTTTCDNSIAERVANEILDTPDMRRH